MRDARRYRQAVRRRGGWKAADVACVDSVMSQPTDLGAAGPRAGVRERLRVRAAAVALTGVAREVPPVEVVPRDWRRLERRSALGPERVERRPWCITAVLSQGSAERGVVC